MRRVLAVLLVTIAAVAAGCGDDDDEAATDTTSAAAQAREGPAKAARCSQRSFRVAFDPDGTIVVAAADDTLASLSESEQTVSGRCTIVSETEKFDEAGLTESTSEKTTISCNVREPADFVVRGKQLTVAVRPDAIVTASVGGSLKWSNVCLPEDEPTP